MSEQVSEAENALTVSSLAALLGFGVEQSVDVFDHTMRRIYRLIGATPEILAEQGSGKTYISLGLWSFSPLQCQAVARSAKVLPEHSSHWFDLAFGASKRVVPVVTIVERLHPVIIDLKVPGLTLGDAIEANPESLIRLESEVSVVVKNIGVPTD